LSLSVIIDENIPPSIADFLHSKRPHWEIHHVRDLGLRGASDATIFDWAQKHGAIVITFDEDFADTRM
jgi:predicted nuclease of predicted toxin-antitoxin system